MTSTRTKLREKLLRTAIQYAFLRWESAVVVSGTLLLTTFLPHPFDWWPIWGWPLLGVLGLGAIVYSSLTDTATSAKLLNELFERHFDPTRIDDARLREEMRTALTYQQQIEAQLQQQRPGVLRGRLEDTAGQLSEWVSNIYRLALRLDAYQQDALLAAERERVPGEIDRLLRRRAREQDPALIQDLDEVLQGKQQQLKTLKALETRMRQAELQLQQSLTALATVYSQVQLIDAQDVGSGRSERLLADIQEQVEKLNDLVRSINEVYDLDHGGPS